MSRYNPLLPRPVINKMILCRRTFTACRRGENFAIMSRLDTTLVQLAPGVRHCRDSGGSYRPRHGLAIYYLPTPGWQISSPGMVLGEALAGRSGLGCTLLEGVPEKIPEGAVVVGKYDDLKSIRPDLLEDTAPPANQTEYTIKLARSGLVAANSPEALAQGMQTLAMLVLRYSGETIPGCVITDSPLRPVRCLAIELDSHEISAVLLMQIVSFAATFKANRIHIILNDDFEPIREIHGLDNIQLACASSGIVLGVRVKALNKILTGELTIIQAWSKLRAAARAFGASEAAFDDVCPGDADPEILRKLVESAVLGESGLRRVSLDAHAIVISGVDVSRLAGAGITGWQRIWEKPGPIPTEFAGIPLVIDVQAPVLGLTSHTQSDFQNRLDTAMVDFSGGDVQERGGREFMVSFRNIGVSHMWQNLLYPAATALISAWGCPSDAKESAQRVLGLLYGESSSDIEEMWNTVTLAFPPDLSEEEEMLFRRTAFGYWPETEEEWETLVRPDWLKVANHIRTAAQSVQGAADALTRNISTLIGARLNLYALSWLHCFTALLPELEGRLQGVIPEDGRTMPIAKELFGNFRNWLECVRETQKESGLEFSELPALEEMGAQIREMCRDSLEPGLDDLQGTITVE